MSATFTASLHIDTTQDGRGEATVDPARSWHPLYRIGGISALLAALAYIVATAAYFVVAEALTL